ncbi:MAG: HmuY family protein [Saprospiraceae bacterium]
MRLFTFLFFFILNIGIGLSQDFVLVSVGESYGLQSYYSLSNDNESQIDNNDWDIAFHYFDGSLLINESSKTTFLEPAKELRCYATPFTDFNQTFTSDDVTDRLWNEEASWSKGAFNTVKDSGDASDFGWGKAEGNGNYTGTRVFALRLKSTSWIKLQVINVTPSTLNFRIAGLNGANLQTVSIPLNGTSEGDFVYYSIEKDLHVQTIPSSWDMVFKRYVTPIDDNLGGFLDYTVTGVLSFPGTQVAQATHVDPIAVEISAYQDSFSKAGDAIGYDWKNFDFENSNEWTVYEDYAFFIKTRSGGIWKIVFIDFEGTSTGNIVFQKYFLGTSSVNQIEGNDLDLKIFPNPVNSSSQIIIDGIQKSQYGDLLIYDLMGRQVYRQNVSLNSGLNVLHLHDLNLANGQYILKVQTQEKRISKPIIVTR